jgi:hypothetical protein
MSKDIAYFVYHRKDDNMLLTCINSLRVVNPNCSIVIVTDGVPEGLKDKLRNDYNVIWFYVTPSQMNKRRATCKIEMLNEIVKDLENSKAQILVSDVDIYFQGDPFVPFEEYPDMDLGLTTRGYPYAFPINAGIFYIRVNDKMKSWVQWHIDEILKPSWGRYIQLHINQYRHRQRLGLDWAVSQDFLIANWLYKDEVKKLKGVNIIDVGPQYNFCPPVDTMKNKAFELIRESLIKKDKVVLHLKSDLKKMIYEGIFPNAKIEYPKGETAWL